VKVEGGNAEKQVGHRSVEQRNVGTKKQRWRVEEEGKKERERETKKKALKHRRATQRRGCLPKGERLRVFRYSLLTLLIAMAIAASSPFNMCYVQIKP